MAVKKKGLGRGLDALFPEKSVKPAEKKPEQKPVASKKLLLFLSSVALCSFLKTWVDKGECTTIC